MFIGKEFRKESNREIVTQPIHRERNLESVLPRPRFAFANLSPAGTAHLIAILTAFPVVPSALTITSSSPRPARLRGSKTLI
jgi:hypothetical protein